MAGITPDPKKRSYLLPPGCKDLSDVLQREKQRNAQPNIATSQRFTLSRSGEDKGGLNGIEKYVAMVFESCARSFTLTVTPRDERFTVDVVRRYDGTISADVSVQQGIKLERAVRDFFTQRDLPTPDNSGIPAQFYPDLPVYLSYDLLPVALDAAQLVRLMTALLREISEATDDSGLSFSYREITDAA